MVGILAVNENLFHIKCEDFVFLHDYFVCSKKLFLYPLKKYSIVPLPRISYLLRFSIKS